ncbi:MAG TPA: chromate transporter [Anaeromyxobacter sp.]|nr:chromate transporter [Anaeromyxobacter sp.]
MEATTATLDSTLAPRPLPRDERDPWPGFLRTMAWVGLNTFGGPVAQIGFMHRVAVEERRWLADGQFVHLLNFANVLPGPEALEIAIHLGYLRRGILGGIAAGVLFIWPGFVALTALAWVYTSYGHVAGVAGFLDGVRPVAMALVAAAAIRISRKVLKGRLSYVLMGAAFLASYALGVPFVAILVACGALGLALGGRHRESKQADPRVHGWLFVVLVAGLVAGARLSSSGPAPAARPERAEPAEGRREAPAAAPARLVDVAWVNTKAALVTFGGAYTVLPYLREQTVDRHGWLDDRQVVDGLALGETTPGPLICVGIFLSYLAAGFPGAVVGCFFLFLPSFVLVLGLGRYIDKVENLPRARDVLWGFSAGTLGLIVALAANLFPTSVPDPFAAAIGALAFAAVWRFDVNLVLVVLIGGGLGLVRAHA